MKETKRRGISAVLLLVDVFLIVTGLFATQWIIWVMRGELLNDVSYPLLVGVFIIFFLYMYDLYNAQPDTVYNSMVAALLATVEGCACGFLIDFVFRLGGEKPHIAALISIAIIVVLLTVWRTVAAKWLNRYGVKRSCLILEDMNNTSRLARKIKYATNSGRESYYYMIDENNEEEVQQIIDEKIAQYDMVFLSPHVSDEVASRIMNKAFMLGKTVSVLADMDGVSTLRGKIYQIDDTPVIEKKGLQMSKMQQAIKRAFDIMVALFLSILTAPVALACAIAVKLDSPGPVIYKQERYTKGKKVFKVYKFRTMVQDAEKNGAQLATEGDPRITKSGKFLRATRLDELPQLYNILLGSMSVVGPRPERPIFADEFAKKVASYDMRHSVKAGLTGYAQVYGKYNTRVSDKILMDMIYIVNFSIMLDLKIILLTVKTMFMKSATEGVDEERDAMLSSVLKEQQRRESTMERFGEEHEDIDHYTGV